MFLHPKYDHPTLAYDIALLKLKDSLDLNIYTPACLPEANSGWLGETAWVYGWGIWDNTIQETSPVLNETKQVIISDDECGIKKEAIIKSVPLQQIRILVEETVEVH